MQNLHLLRENWGSLLKNNLHNNKGATFIVIVQIVYKHTCYGYIFSVLELLQVEYRYHKRHPRSFLRSIF